MMSILEQIKSITETLSITERLDLIEHLEGSMMDQEEDVMQAWRAVSARRFAELESGSVTGVPLDQVFKRQDEK